MTNTAGARMDQHALACSKARHLKKRLRPGVVTDAKAAFSSLDWACAAGADPRCIAMYANHDPEVEAGTRSLV